MSELRVVTSPAIERQVRAPFGARTLASRVRPPLELALADAGLLRKPLAAVTVGAAPLRSPPAWGWWPSTPLQSRAREPVFMGSISRRWRLAIRRRRQRAITSDS